jgi:hypothetical protein
MLSQKARLISSFNSTLFNLKPRDLPLSAYNRRKASPVGALYSCFYINGVEDYKILI